MTDKYIKGYKEKLEDETYSIRVGDEVPEGDVNLGYIHTPRLDHEENVALVNTSSDPDNVIPYEQKESIVVPDYSGKLSYANLHPGANSVQEKSPFDIFPSKEVNITRQFKSDNITTEDALYYKFEIMYHYDSMINEPNKVIKYTGDQIQLTDENGHPITSNIKYDIYVMATEENPHIHWVKIYLNKTTDMLDTFKIRYNHIDEITADRDVQSTSTELELYRNADNQIVANESTKQLVEGGKLRIINSGSAFDFVDAETFTNAEDTDEIYHVVEDPIKNGYEIYVKQKSEMDPRSRRIFNYKVIAKYKDSTGADQEVSTGYINDWAVNEEVLLNHERYAYTGEWKQVGVPNGETKFNAKDMVQLALPIGTPSIPEEAEYEIYDAQGNLMYTTSDSPDNPTVSTIIQEDQNDFGAAKAEGLPEDKWHNAEYPNTMLKSHPIDHTVSVIAERQKTQWDYEFKATGEGFIGIPTVYTGNWWACADVGIYKSLTTSPLDILNKKKWSVIGNSVNTNDWKVGVRKDGVSYIELQKNDVEVSGFYQSKGPDNQDMINAKDYEFSTKVKMIDMGDDDVVGLIFRVRDAKNYYMFAWERESLLNDSYIYSDSDYPDGATEKPAMNGTGRIIFEDRGCAAFSYDPNYEYSSPKTDNEEYIYNDWDEYVEAGFGNQKKRIYKAKTRPSNVPPSTGSFGPTYGDSTGSSFEDVTDKGSVYNSELGGKGWELDKEYKITVVVAGANFKIYINENANSIAKGQLVCEGTDSTYTAGSVGIFCTSQRWTQWRDMVYNEIEVSQLCSNQHPITLGSQEQVRASDERVTTLLDDVIKAYAKEKYGNADYEVFSYTAYSDKNDIFLDIDEYGFGYVWASTTNSAAGGMTIEPWYTSDSNLDVYGSGHVQYHEDGHFTVTVNPERLPTEKIPYFVEGFHWKDPVVTKGENITLELDEDGETIIAIASVPPITPLNNWTVIKPEPIHIADGLISIDQLLGEGNIMDRLNIPEDIPKHEILLRIERGEAISATQVVNQEHRVNYRFRLNDDGLIRYPVDQFRDELGVNRLRLSGMYQEYLPVEFEIDYEVLVPKNKRVNMQDLFARNANGATMIESTPGSANWKIVDGDLVDESNVNNFVASYNKNHLNTTNHVTDFSFKTTGDDDDLVGAIFRVQDNKNFYFYALEGDKINPVMAGSRLADVQPNDLYSWKYDRRRDYKSNADFITKSGWKVYHQRVYKVKNGVKSVVAEKSVITNQGHVLNWQNNIRIESNGKTTNLYFQTGVINEADWQRAYQIETEWDKGAYGVFNLSQIVEFLNIETSDLISVKGKIPNLNYTGRPSAIMEKNTKAFADDSVREQMKQEGFTGREDYMPISYTGTVTNGNGEVSVALTGEGPIQVYSYVDPSIMVADVDLVAWTHHEDLEAVPVFAIRIDEERKIDIEKPKVEESKLEVDNWHLRVKNGRFQKVLNLPYYEPEERTPSIYQYYPELKVLAPKDIDDIEEITLEYNIPEYTNQEFYDKPITLIEKESPIILDEFAIQTRHYPIVLQSNQQISYIEVVAFRNNKARVLKVKDIDARKGIIYLIDRIRDQDEVFVRYAYHERWFTYYGFNMGDKKFQLDLNPSPGHSHTVASDGFFQWIPVTQIDLDTPVEEKPSKELLVKPIHVYLRPVFIKDKEGKIIEGTQRTEVIHHTDEDYWFDIKNYKFDHSMFRLGKIILQANSSIDKDSVVLDTRSRGGGLDEALSRKIIEQVNKESLHHWDIGYFDGEAYQENGVMIIRLPETILKSESNPKGFEKSEVHAAVQKHKVYGVLPIIEYYNPETLEKKPLEQIIDKEKTEVFEI